MFKVYYKSPICYLSLHSDGEFLTKLEFCERKGEERNCELLRQAKDELKLYFSGKLKVFRTPLRIKGSEFEQKVYRTLIQIPYGELMSYKQVAEKIGHENAFRAVGNANSKNELPIFIPCHRVVASKGLGGYNEGLKFKRFLLELEGVNLKNF